MTDDCTVRPKTVGVRSISQGTGSDYEMKILANIVTLYETSEFIAGYKNLLINIASK